MFRPDRPFVTIITAINGLRLSPFTVGIWRQSSLWAAATFLAAMPSESRAFFAETHYGFDAGNG
ncbi:MAG: hypothetical protein OEW68_07455 [Gammaproteobacteria bacterium]|nr:hypothetical protein [Gammaproteobacteria bacterium]MDH4314661.1 hypothetical protein [Gammaproteobacteria bacterium]MDH5213392.1 hypothetical protein [Gammaproteobacteria bacterium]